MGESTTKGAAPAAVDTSAARPVSQTFGRSPAARSGPPPMRIRLGSILWPAFVMAGVMEGLFFSVVDPNDMRWFGIDPVGLPREVVYSLTFFICWVVIALSGGVTALLCLPAEEVNRRSLAKHFP